MCSKVNGVRNRCQRPERTSVSTKWAIYSRPAVFWQSIHAAHAVLNVFAILPHARYRERLGKNVSNPVMPWPEGSAFTGSISEGVSVARLRKLEFAKSETTKSSANCTGEARLPSPVSRWVWSAGLLRLRSKSAQAPRLPARSLVLVRSEGSSKLIFLGFLEPDAQKSLC